MKNIDCSSNPSDCDSGSKLLLPSLVLVIALLSLCSPLLAQQTPVAVQDSSKISKKWNMSHSPLKATIYSAVLPGAGQVYNKKIWKVPIVYAGLGTCAGFIIYNNQKYHRFLDAYIAETDGDETTINDTPYSASSLFDIQDTYHSWRDLSYICLVGVYVLQIIDASVDAHLSYFDVSDDLSLNWRPSLIDTGRLNGGISLSLQF